MSKLTKNELKMLNFLTRHASEKYSINQLAKKVGLTPKGAHKLLKRLEQEAVIRPQKLGNAVFYSLNFASDFALNAAELSLFEDILLPYARVQAKDLEVLRPVALAAILFGSVLEKGEKASDIDIMAVIEPKQYRAFQKALKELQKIKPKRIHLVLQLPQDLVRNIKKADPVLLDILHKGNILWGRGVIINAIKEAIA